PGPNTLEQLPDVQRAWLTPSGPAGAFWYALGAQLLLALVLLHIGRLRLRRARQLDAADWPELGAAPGGTPRAAAHWRGWVIAAAAFAIIAVALRLLRLATVGWEQVGVI